jgi:hypothetical protein
MGLILEALLRNNTGIQFSFALRMALDIIETFRGGIFRLLLVEYLMNEIQVIQLASFSASGLHSGPHPVLSITRLRALFPKTYSMIRVGRMMR